MAGRPGGEAHFEGLSGQLFETIIRRRRGYSRAFDLPPSRPAMPDNPAPMDHTFLSALILLLLVLDPFGSLPIFISILGAVKPERRTFVALREVLIAFAVLVALHGDGAGLPER